MANETIKKNKEVWPIEQDSPWGEFSSKDSHTQSRLVPSVGLDEWRHAKKVTFLLDLHFIQRFRPIFKLEFILFFVPFSTISAKDPKTVLLLAYQ